MNDRRYSTHATYADRLRSAKLKLDTMQRHGLNVRQVDERVTRKCVARHCIEHRLG